MSETISATHTEKNAPVINLDKYDGIIFDMDGTLVDSMGVHITAWEEICMRFGYPFDAEYMNSLGGVPTRETVIMLNEKYGQNHDVDQVASEKRMICDMMDFVPPLIKETYSVFMHYLGSKPMGVGTGSDRIHAEEVLKHHRLLEKIDALVTSSDVSNGKPHPETFLSVAETLGVEPSRCVVLEDTMIGIQAATDAGMDSVLVKNGRIVVR